MRLLSRSFRRKLGKTNIQLELLLRGCLGRDRQSEPTANQLDGYFVRNLKRETIFLCVDSDISTLPRLSKTEK